MHFIAHPEKIGIGTWDKDNRGTALNDVDRVNFSWYYNWSERALWDVDLTPELSVYTPMLWGGLNISSATASLIQSLGATTLLGFNEPDNAPQANITVEQAIALWPLLQATGLRLGSPAPTMQGVLGPDSWLGRFMAQAIQNGLRVDFIAVHYYSTDKDVGAFKAWLETVHEQYNKPIWVTEWALADWNNPDRFTAEEQAAFARAGMEMMDDLAFVEKHAWFAAYEGGDGWHLKSGLFDADGNLTAVGRVFAELTSPSVSQPDAETPDLPTVPTTPSIVVVVGTSRKDTLVGGAEDNLIKAGAGNDTLSGNAGNDQLWGGPGNDVLTGGTGSDIFVFDTKPNTKTNRDTVRDFSVAYDSIWLDNAIFRKLGTEGTKDQPVKIAKGYFSLNEAKDKNDYIVYNKKTGVLSYDPDGSGSGTAIQVAVLKKSLSLSYHDFYII